MISLFTCLKKQKNILEHVAKWRKNNNFNDVWPPLNGIYNEGDTFIDCGADMLCPEDDGYLGPDFGENNGSYDSCP